jgi:ZIP family zinc transporter
MSGTEAAIVLGAGALSIAGVAFALLAATMARRVTDLLGIAGGCLILFTALTHLAPEALAAGDVARAFFIAGAVLGVGLEIVFRARAGRTPAAAQLGAWLSLGVLGLHSTLDGAVYTAVFWHGEGSAEMASLGLILHEAPEGVVAMALALRAGLRPAVAGLMAIMASSLTTPLGWVIAHAVGEAGHSVMEPMFAASAGLLLFVGWHLISDGWRALRARPEARS